MAVQSVAVRMLHTCQGDGLMDINLRHISVIRTNMSQRLSSPAPSSSRRAKSQRVLACVLCQQRKVKCDRNFPCANCTRSGASCVPAVLVPRRPKRRFPERDLLARLRTYEDLLRQHRVKFEPLHAEADDAPDGENMGDETADQAVKSSPTTPGPVHEAKNFWHAMNQAGCEDPLNSDSPDDVLQTDTVMDAWDQLFAENDNLLLSSRRSKVDLSSLHPGPVDVLRLWQIYLDHINPLLKVSYIPELQPRVVNAVSQLNDVGESLEALLFGIYCVSIQSLSTEECEATLGAPKEDLLRAYLFGSKQALLNCNITRTADRECLTALLLYLVSIGSTTDPRSVSSVFSVAVRLAQRMGLHSEAANLKHPVLEAEMRRRLWWALVLFDARIGELADNKSTALSPTWDCRRPLNVNDSDLWPRMTDAPAAHSQPTEAIFVVLRSHLGDFIRYADFYLDFNAPAVRSLARYHHRQQDPDSMPRLETVIGDGYLQCCDEKNPLQLFTAWVTRGTIAKYNLLAYYSSCSWTSDPPSEKHRDVAMSYALDILHYDTQIHTSPLTRGYQWLLQFYFPFPAYVHLAQELKRRPFGTLAHQAWDAMAANYNARFDSPSPSNPLFRLLSRIILQAWRPREAAFHSPGEDTTPPVIVASIRRQMALSPSPTESSDCIDGVPLPQPEFPDADQIGSMPGPFGPYQLNDWDLTTTDSMSLSTMAALEGPAADSDVKLDFYQVDWALGGPYGL